MPRPPPAGGRDRPSSPDAITAAGIPRRRSKLGHRAERPRARHRLQGVGDRVGMVVLGEPLADHLEHRLAQCRRHARLAVGGDEALDAAGTQSRQQARPNARAARVVGLHPVVGRRYDNHPPHPLRDTQRQRQQRVGAHRGAGEHRTLEAEVVEHRLEVGGQPARSRTRQAPLPALSARGRARRTRSPGARSAAARSNPSPRTGGSRSGHGAARRRGRRRPPRRPG